MPVRHPFNEIYSSGCFVGFQQASFDGIVKWVGLSKTPKPLNNSIVTKDAIQFIDTKNKWSTVRGVERILTFYRSA
jgi:hypothetical protein